MLSLLVLAPAQQPTQRPLAVIADGSLHTTSYGKWPKGFVQEYFTGAGSIWSSGTTLTLQGNDRAYMIDDVQASSWPAVRYNKLNLLGKTLKYTADFSGVGCGCNAGLYLVAMKSSTYSGSGYCDVQMKKEACLEIDLQEGNRKAMATTLHTRYEFKNATGKPPPLADDVCNQWGCGVNWGKDDDSKYGQHSTTGIDSARPYDVHAKFDADGRMEVALWQDETKRVIWNVTKAGTPNGHAGIPSAETARVKKAMEDGMVLVVSLWDAPLNNMSWLDGGCTKAYPHCNLASTRALYTNIRVEANDDAQVEHS